MKKIKLYQVVAIFFFAAVALYFISPVADVDFPWHLKTGEYIFQHKDIPHKDPFSIFSGGGRVERFLLSQYWLAQVFFYLIYKSTGFLGIILLRSLVFTGIIAIIWKSMKHTPLAVKVFVLYWTAILFHFYSNDRPQFFSFLFGAAMIVLLINYTRSLSLKYAAVLPLIMLIWANSHGGYVFGNVTIAVFCICEALKYFLGRESDRPLPGKAMLVLASIGLATVLLSYLNPNIYYAVTFSVDSVATAGVSGIREYISPVVETSGAFASRYNFIYWALVGYSMIVLVLNSKRLDLSHLGLYLFAISLSLSASRFVPFFAITGLIVSGQYPSPWDRLPAQNRLTKPVGLAILSIVIYGGVSLASTRAPLNTLMSLPSTVFFPESACSFLIDNVKGGNLFNARNSGSYFLYRLYPSFKTLIDTRSLDNQVLKDYNSILFAQRFDHDKESYMTFLNALLNDTSDTGDVRGLRKEAKWEELLKKYEMDVIVHEACNAFTGIIYPLTLSLINNDQWKLVYIDGKVFIYVRDIPRFRTLIEEHELDKEKIYDEIGMESARQMGKSNHAPVYSSLAFALLMKDGPDKTIDNLISHATNLDPDDIQTSLIEAFISLKRIKNR